MLFDSQTFIIFGIKSQTSQGSKDSARIYASLPSLPLCHSEPLNLPPPSSSSPALSLSKGLTLPLTPLPLCPSEHLPLLLLSIFISA